MFVAFVHDPHVPCRPLPDPICPLPDFGAFLETCGSEIFFANDARLERRKGTKKKVAVYRQKAARRSVLQMAAKAWADGVPWEEALQIAKRVSARLVAKGKGSGKGR